MFIQIARLTGRRVLIVNNVRYLRRAFNHPRVAQRNIFLMRDGRAVVASTLRKRPGRSTWRAIRSWVRGTKKRARYVQRRRSRSILVHYESLQKQTDYELRRICDWLGLSFEPSMVAFENTEPHFLGGNAGPIIAVGDANDIDLRDQYTPGEHFVPLDREHYEQTDPDRYQDERWRRELSAGQLRLFNLLAGRLNRKYGYSTDVSASG